MTLNTVGFREVGMSRPVKIQLLGQSFTIRTSESDEHVADVSRLVNERLGDLRKKGASDDRTLALFTALTLADELVKERRNGSTLKDSVRSRAQILLDVSQE